MLLYDAAVLYDQAGHSYSEVSIWRDQQPNFKIVDAQLRFKVCLLSTHLFFCLAISGNASCGYWC